MSRSAISPLKQAAVRADPSDPHHGTWNGYVNYGCHCPRCTEAARTAEAEQRRRKKVKAEQSKRINTRAKPLDVEGVYGVPQWQQDVVAEMISRLWAKDANDLRAMLGIGDRWN